MSAAHYFTRMGGTKSPVLARLAIDLWEWCLQQKIHVKAQYLPGVLNIRADRESRVMLDLHDWKLDPLVLAELNQLWGPLEVDLFASRLSTKLPRFYSWRPDPQAEAVDAFSQDWSSVKGYAFPPFALIGRCLKQILDQQVSFLVLVAPVWQAQPWYPLLLEMCCPSSSPSTVSGPGGSTPPLKPAVSRVATVKQSYSKKGISEGAQNLFVAAWRKGTSSAYSLAWGKWDSWCRERKINSVHAPVEAILEFLTYEYNAGKAYRMLNVYRSAISSTHPSIDSERVGEHP